MDGELVDSFASTAPLVAMGVAALPIPGARIGAAAIEGAALLSPLLTRYLDSRETYKMPRSFRASKLQHDKLNLHRRRRMIAQRH